jgi:hypothetical protein
VFFFKRANEILERLTFLLMRSGIDNCGGIVVSFRDACARRRLVRIYCVAAQFRPCLSTNPEDRFRAIGPGHPGCLAAGSTGKEATMELNLRLNVLAALLSFGFLAAVTLGMV